MAQDRRKHPRIRAYLPVSLQPRDNPKTMQTLTKDLSVEGLRCLSPEAIPVATEFRVQLTLGAGYEPVTLQGRTQWLRSIPYGDQFEIGLSFPEVSPEITKRLSAYLDRLDKRAHPVAVSS